MWAGSQFEFRTPLRVGDHAERALSTIDGDHVSSRAAAASSSS
jgi:hydroxyacyl-ACP dehydratase HTD2-like protein with hotdog domain